MTQRENILNNYITIPELAKIMNLSRSQVFRKVQAGQISAEKIGNVYFVNREIADSVSGKLAQNDQENITKAVEKTIKDYGEVIKQLGDE
ncbi:MAG: hypothetical protein CEN91_174 [Candidatus Berkelbacteria bacterium Licking1014_85]|uniref:Helix-turn-helix domain-containing protein n=1 Tax=Candidatus Berkelbacteria bacterium Licking1014_85 TaxID=2017148 RepID=A0A554LLA1_9BACT|nr:MAG: hypothetical protein CEN91_174 [Candidatus Berkelbacteria bacterium Licking1014_85]